MNGLMDMKHLQRSKNQSKFHYMPNELICQKEIRVFPGNLERVGVILLAIPENPHGLLIFLAGGAVRAFVDLQHQKHSYICLKEVCSASFLKKSFWGAWLHFWWGLGVERGWLLYDPIKCQVSQISKGWGNFSWPQGIRKHEQNPFLLCVWQGTTVGVTRREAGFQWEFKYHLPIHQQTMESPTCLWNCFCENDRFTEWKLEVKKHVHDVSRRSRLVFKTQLHN